MASRSREIRLLQKGCIPGLKHHILFSLRKRVRFVLCPLPSTVLRASLLISFPAGTKMLQFPAFPLLRSNSGIPGSKAACASPRLIAACHALLRLSSRVIHYAAYATLLICLLLQPMQAFIAKLLLRSKLRAQRKLKAREKLDQKSHQVKNPSQGSTWTQWDPKSLLEKGSRKKYESQGYFTRKYLDPVGLEPTASALQGQRSTN